MSNETFRYTVELNSTDGVMFYVEQDDDGAWISGGGIFRIEGGTYVDNGGGWENYYADEAGALADVADTIRNTADMVEGQDEDETARMSAAILAGLDRLPDVTGGESR